MTIGHISSNMFVLLFLGRSGTEGFYKVDKERRKYSRTEGKFKFAEDAAYCIIRKYRDTACEDRFCVLEKLPPQNNLDKVCEESDYPDIDHK